MRTFTEVTVEVLPTLDQAKALAQQLVYVKQILAGCPVGAGNPFGQRLKTFSIQHKAKLWAAINIGMMGFGESTLRDQRWNRQMNYRCGTKGLEMIHKDSCIYIPQLLAEGGGGRLLVKSLPEFPPNIRIPFLTIRVTPPEEARWLVVMHTTDRPPQARRKKRRY
jgi:hypothetical protein